MCEILFPLGKTAANTATMLQEAFKDEAIGKTQVYVWFNRFKRGGMSVENQPRCGRPSMCRTDGNVEKVRQAVFADRHWTIDEISWITGASRSSHQRIFTEDSWNRLLQNSWRVSSHRSKELACECLPWFAGTAQKWPSVSPKSCNTLWELVLWLRHWDNAAVKSVEVTKFA